MKNIILLTVIALSTIFKSFGQLPPANIQNNITLSLNSYKQALLLQNGIDVAGWMVRVEKEGQWQQTWVNGVADSQTNMPLNGTEKFRIGNISQTFMAVAILKLVQDNSLQLSNPITSWLPIATTSLIPNAATITIKNLLQHTSGIANYNDGVIVSGEPTAAAITTDWYNSNFINNYTFNDIMNTYFTTYQAVAMPSNNVFNYSETNYLLLGEIIQNCSGLKWQQYIQQKIIAPLNLSDTTCILDNTFTNPTNMMSGYVISFDSAGNSSDINATVQNNSIYKGSRGMISTLADLNTFWKSVRQGAIIPLNLATLLQTCDAFPDGDPTQFGFGLGCTEPNQGFNWIGSDGYVEGYCSSMYYLPNIDAYLSVVNNKFIVSNLVLIAEIENIINDFYLSNSNFETTTFSIYPNPVTNAITISSKNTIEEIKIYDILGRNVYSENNNDKLKMNIDVSSFDKGNYIIKIKSTSKISTRKFIKN